MEIEFIKWDKGGNLHCKINGLEYCFAFQEWYGGKSIYGICLPGNDFFTFLSRSKRVLNFYNKIKEELFTCIANNPETE